VLQKAAPSSGQVARGTGACDPRAGGSMGGEPNAVQLIGES
jgi:hypothetical protein